MFLSKWRCFLSFYQNQNTESVSDATFSKKWTEPLICLNIQTNFGLLLIKILQDFFYYYYCRNITLPVNRAVFVE